MAWLITGKNVPGTWAEIEGVHTNCSRSVFSFMPNNYKSGWLVRYDVWELFTSLNNKTNKFWGSDLWSGSF